MSHKIIIVEGSEFYGKLLKHSISHSLGFQVIWFKSYREAEVGLPTHVESGEIIMAILDYHLPDAMDGAIVDLCLSHNIPSLVMTSTFSPDIQEVIWSKKVIDYVIKEGSHSVGYILGMINRFNKNRDIGVLVIDDSTVSRKHLKGLLDVHQYKVYEAENGLVALEILEKTPDIKLALVDYQMPVCDGFEFTTKARKNFPMEKLAIIGISAKGSHAMLIKFIKYGANDFITKPFVSELLYTRINQNIRLIENFESLREVALIDHLTGIHNRRYLFDTGELLFNTARRTGSYITVAMIDIDNFKMINDTFGHDAGDYVIKTLARIFQGSLRSTDILTRYGGEEFCIIGNNMDPKDAILLFESVRTKIEDYDFSHEGKKISVTASFGLCIEKKNSLTDMINAADAKLYEAKEKGKNRVCL
ncbi:GGDEF domain-containing response regulator [Spirochaeta isovalerica]|uniref:diguanylate cyclase n=1 Tax=Spirochaeta isovalerica TaxID=150 RepID=A0A841RCW6_9SPIO|nr:diguanylate cyclase [Spirochaeta isovalerica]MBB6480699.1 diguanylate cyclase (GGDEF)-like protein [Spirochaeta isovalerica]